MTTASTVQQKPSISVEPENVKGVRVLVCGNADVEPRRIVRALDALVANGEIIEEVIHHRDSYIGKVAAAWADVNGAMRIVFPDLWGQDDKNRHRRLLAAKPDFVVVFSDGQRDLDLLQRADRMNIRVWQHL